MLLVLADATHGAVVANYGAGFRGAAQHRGHGWSYDAAMGRLVPAADDSWSEEELDAALADRRPALTEWLEMFDVEAYLRASGLDESTLRRLKSLLAG